jgi:Uma2 family endonuclease
MATTPTTKPRRPTRTKPAPTRSPSPLETPATVGDLLKRLGDIPAWRVRLHPAPGTATEKHVIKVLEGEDRLCELVEGTLVEKPMGYEQSEIAATIIILMGSFVRSRKLGIVTGADGAVKLFAGLVRIPDVAFASWNRFPGRRRPKVAVPLLAPDLVVEVLSKGNTLAEMRRKLGEYFDAGVRLVWLVDPRKKTVRVHTAVEQSVLLKEGQSLDGGDVLPGFTLSLEELFEEPAP